MSLLRVYFFLYSFLKFGMIGFGINTCRSTSLRNSSMKLHMLAWASTIIPSTYITGRLITNTAVHSVKLSGTIANNVCRTGV
jgi:hypothetical protein